MHALHTGTSPVLWNGLKNGNYTVTVKGYCSIEGIQISSQVLKIEFQID